ncbi:MAG: zf-HC2 protein [Frankiales bacterium]|nr:zf-HC2 protein [Frankiales bacterium]
MSERVCQEVQAQLPAYVDLSLPRLRRKLVALHLRRCAACQAEFSIQRELHVGLSTLAGAPSAPPEGLLESLLENSSSPRGAAPLRGAVSGAKPVLSVALLVAGAAAGAGAGYVSWLSAKNVRRRLR